MNQVANRNDAPKPALRTGGAIASIVPQNIEEAYRLSDAIHQAGMAPFGLDTPQKVMIAMMTGLELEMPPMQAVQSIAVINNRPCMWGDALIGVVRKSPLCLWVREWIEGQGDDRIAYCETKRKGEEHPVVRSFSVDDAKRAKLWSTDAIVTKRSKNGGTYDKENDSPWYRYPQRMLQMRARAWCLRDTYADVLKGMQVREEVEDYQHEPAPAAVELRREPSRFAARLTAEPASEPQAATEGFRQDFIDAELGTRPGADTGTADASAGSSDQDAIDDVGDIDPDAPAASHAEASEREADHAESSANRDPVIRNLLTECAAKLLSIAAGSGDPQNRTAALTAAKDAWKGELTDNLVDLKRIFDRTYAVITGKSNVAAAVQLLATELGLKASEIQPEAN